MADLRPSDVDKLIAVSKKAWTYLQTLAVDELDGTDPIPELLHGIITCWLDELLDAGVLDDEDDPRFDAISGPIAEIAAIAFHARTVRRG